MNVMSRNREVSNALLDIIEREECAPARELAAWTHQVSACWPNVSVGLTRLAQSLP